MKRNIGSTQARLFLALTGLAFAFGCSSRDDTIGAGDGGSGAVTATGGAGGVGGAAVTPSGGGSGTDVVTASTGGDTGAGACAPGAATGGAGGSSTFAKNPVAWQTSTVSLVADDFWIVANGTRFDGKGLAIDVHSDPGDPTYTSLELIWTEQGREMRFFIYFYAPDPSGWFSNEMRTYDGQVDSDWLFYRGTFFLSPIGSAFHGDLDVTNVASDATRGELHLHGVTLSTDLTGVCSFGTCLGSGAQRTRSN